LAATRWAPAALQAGDAGCAKTGGQRYGRQVRRQFDQQPLGFDPRQIAPFEVLLQTVYLEGRWSLRVTTRG
jgi:hypothetical protein